MARRGNKRVGAVARVMIALSIALVLIAIVVAATAIRDQRANPGRGSSTLPVQAERAGVQRGQLPPSN